MTTVKSYTDLQQSKKLAEILPLESADMCFASDGTAIKIDANPYNVRKHMWKDIQLIPCWSLASLLNVMPFWYDIHPVKNGVAIKCDYGKEEIVISSNAVDACVEMIIKLHELNLL